jgi:hypothetical protein
MTCPMPGPAGTALMIEESTTALYPCELSALLLLFAPFFTDARVEFQSRLHQLGRAPPQEQHAIAR